MAKDIGTMTPGSIMLALLRNQGARLTHMVLLLPADDPYRLWIEWSVVHAKDYRQALEALGCHWPKEPTGASFVGEIRQQVEPILRRKARLAKVEESRG